MTYRRSIPLTALIALFACASDTPSAPAALRSLSSSNVRGIAGEGVAQSAIIITVRELSFAGSTALNVRFAYSWKVLGNGGSGEGEAGVSDEKNPRALNDAIVAAAIAYVNNTEGSGLNLDPRTTDVRLVGGVLQYR